MEYAFEDQALRVTRAMDAVKTLLHQGFMSQGDLPCFLGVKGFSSRVDEKLEQNNLMLPDKKEAYVLHISATGITIIGNDLIGLFHGIQTLRQLKITPGIGYILLPQVTITDYPSLEYRGIHVFTGKDALAEQKALIDLMAMWKMNQLVLQVDYLKYDSHPEIFFSTWGQTKESVRELIRYAKDRFIEISPLVAGPAHAEWIFRTGHHYDLAEDPEPSANMSIPFTYCITNPDTYTFLFEIYDEVLELFRPRYFHIGHDEIDMEGWGRFPYRSAGYTKQQLIEMDLDRLTDYFRGRNIDLMLWGDMFLYLTQAPDAANADNLQQANSLRQYLKTLSSGSQAPEFIFCDWHYGAYSPERYNSIPLLHQEGFKTLASTWYLHNNIRNFTRQQVLQNGLGLLQTTWAGFTFKIQGNTSCYDQFVAYLIAAEYSWSGRTDPSSSFAYTPSTVFWDQWKKVTLGQTPIMGDAESFSKTWTLY